MAHYAFIDNENKVTEVIVGKDENEIIDGLSPEEWYGNFRGERCIRTSFNSKIRANFAGKGFSYNEEKDVFIPPMPECGHEELILDEKIFQWNCTNSEHEVDSLIS